MRLNHKGFRWDNAHTIHSWQMIIHTLSKLLAMRGLYVSGWAVWYMDLPCPQRVKQCHTKYPQIPLSVSVYYPAASSEVNRWKKNETYMSAGFIKDDVDKFLLYRWLIVSATDTSMLQLNGLWSQMSEVVGFCCFEGCMRMSGKYSATSQIVTSTKDESQAWHCISILRNYTVFCSRTHWQREHLGKITWHLGPLHGNPPPCLRAFIHKPQNPCFFAHSKDLFRLGLSLDLFIQ